MRGSGSALRLLAVLFVAVLTTYSAVWMHYIWQHGSAPARDFEHRYRPSEAVVVLTAVRDDGVAARAGLRAGDRIVAVDGRPLESYRTFLDAFGRVPGPPPLLLHVAAADATRVVPFPLVAARDAGGEAAPPDGPWLRALALALTLYPALFLVVATAVLLQRPHDRNAWVMALAFGGLIASAPLLQLEGLMPHALATFVVAVWAFLIVLMPAALYFFFAVFPAPSWLDRKVPWLKYVMGGTACGIGVVLAVACLATGGSHALWWVAERVPEATVGAVFTAYSVSGLLLGMVSLISNAFGDAESRRRTRVILAGALLGFAPLMLLQLIVVASGADHPGEVIPFWAFAVAVLSLSFLPLSVAYAVVKHRVMELPVLIRRSARYLLVRRGAVTGAVLLGLATTLAFAELFARLFTGSTQATQPAALLAGSIFGGTLALTGQRLWRPAQERIDRAFFRGAYDARLILQRLAAESRVATDRDALARLIEQALEEALHPQALYVYLRTDGAAPRLVAAGADAEALATVPLALNAPTMVELARRGLPFVVGPEDLAPDGRLAEYGVLGPEVLVPMLGRAGQLEGLLVLGPRLSEEPYSGEDRELVGSAAAQAGLALENIRLAESIAAQLEGERRRNRELEIAKAVQAKLLPQDAPALATLDCAGRCIQAREVGGDYYDFVCLGQRQLALVLADISGKGISAALLMASLQASLRAQYTRAPGALADVLRTINHVFYESTAPNHYATLFFGIYDEPSRRLVYVNCGHLPPILRRAGGTIDRLDTTAPVVGMFEPWDCAVAEVTLGTGDVLLVFTDGATDAIDAAGEEFGESRLADLVDRHRAAPAADLLDTVVAAVTRHGGTERFDDLTLIAARGL